MFSFISFFWTSDNARLGFYSQGISIHLASMNIGQKSVSRNERKICNTHIADTECTEDNRFSCVLF